MTMGLELRCGDWRAQIVPQTGGAIAALECRGRAILRPTPPAALDEGDVRRTACYPLVPYANRIARGRFRAAGRDQVLRENFPDSPHPLHGVGWRRAWSVVRADRTSCELHLAHRPRGEDALDWPFAFDAVETIRIDAGGLQVALEAVNLEDFPVPLGIGLHPLFPRVGTQRLLFSAAGCWRNGADLLPLEVVSGPPWDHSRGCLVGAVPLDNDFPGWAGEACVEEADGLEVRIAASPAFTVLRVFTPPGRDFFGVEPVSHIADAINRPQLKIGGLVPAPAGGRVAGTVSVGVRWPA